jgi:PAS domain S-box-containing protein
MEPSTLDYRDVINDLPVGVFVCDTDGLLIMANAILHRLCGYTANELIGLPLTSLPDHAEERHTLQSMLARMYGRGNPTSICRIHVTDKNQITHVLRMECTGRNDAQGALIGFVGSVSDITSQAHAEADDLANLRRFKAAFEQSAIGMAIMRAGEPFLEVNQAFCKFLGYSFGELKYRTLKDVTHPDDWCDITLCDTYNLKNSTEKRYFRNDGSIVWGRLTATSFSGTASSGNEVLLQVEDISGLKDAASQLYYRRSFERLLAKISNSFVEFASDEPDAQINATLELLGRFLNADRGGVALFDGERQYLKATHAWSSPSMFHPKHLPRILSFAEFPWMINTLRMGRVLYIRGSADIPAEAAMEKSFWRAQGGRPFLMVPMQVDGHIAGALWFDALVSAEKWHEDDFDLLKTVGQILGGALERDAACKRLQRSEQRLALALAVSNEGVWDLDCRTGEVYFSARYLEMIGYDHDEVPGCFESWSKLLHPEDRDRTLACYHKSVANGGRLDQEFRLLAKDGRTVHIYSRGEVVEYDERGNPARILGTHMDISDRKKVEEALQEANQRLQDIVEFLPDATFVVDRDSRVIAWNRATEIMTGVAKEMMLGQKTYDCGTAIFGEPRPILIDFVLSDTLSAEDWYGTYEYRKGSVIGESFSSVVQNGQGGHIWGIASPLVDQQGCLAGAIESIRDISDRKASEKVLKQALTEAQQAHKRIDAILESVADGLIVSDAEQKVVLMNRAAEFLLGLSTRQIRGQSVAALTGNDDLAHQIGQALFGQEDLPAVEWQNHSDQRIPLILQARSAPVMGSEGRQGGVITILRDVSHERHIDQVKNEFIAMAAHELRTPLTAVMGFAELLLQQDRLDVGYHVCQQEFLQIIYEKSTVLQGIIEDLLDVSRIQLGQMVALDCTSGDLCVLIRQAVATCRQVSKEHEFCLDLPSGEVEGYFDGSKIQQVMNNLISNAVKFSPNGGVIKVSGKLSAGCLVVSVQDQGIGIAAEHLARIFDKFYRADASNTAVGGLGLGLTIVKTIVEAHGGAIEVQSEPGAGTRASFSLPLSLP